MIMVDVSRAHVYIHSLDNGNLEHMVGTPGGCSEGHLECMVDAPSQLLEIAVGGIQYQAWYKKVRKHTVNVETALLSGWGSTKDANNGYLLYN